MPTPTHEPLDLRARVVHSNEHGNEQADKHGNGHHIDEAEWAVRCDLAACYQLVDLYGMTDMAATHISALVPGTTDQFLLPPYGLLFDQVTASCFVKVDVNGQRISGGDGDVNSGGFIIHSAIHLSRPEFRCVLHTHTTANNAVAMLEEGLMPISHIALIILGFVAYHDYEGVADTREENLRMAQELGAEGRIVIMRNHGALSVGRSVAEAFFWMARLENACKAQVAGLSCGRPLQHVSPHGIERVIEQGRKLFGPAGRAYRHGRHGAGDAHPGAVGDIGPGVAEWPSLIHKLERERGSSYRT